MNMPKPGDAHLKLEKFVGQWTGLETIHASPFDPQGGPALGKVQNRLALDGFAVVQDYEQSRHGKVSFRGHAVFRYDTGEECYHLHWFDSMGSPPSLFKGALEGDVFTFTSASPQGHMRAVFDFSKPKTYAYKMNVSPDGRQWFPFMEGTYTRG